MRNIPSLSGKVALVTGAGRGIGRAIAIRFAREGADLVLAARTESELLQTARECRDAGSPSVSVVPTDMGATDQVRRLARDALAVRGHIDVLVNNAGVYGPIGASHEVDANEWEHAHRVNLFGPFVLCRELLPGMIRRKAGKIIFLAGGGATAPFPRLSAYASSKAAVVRLAETLAEEGREHNIQVNAVAPGLVDTRLQDEVLRAGERAGPVFGRIREARDQGRGAVPPELAAELVAFLASDASGALTGKLISARYDPWREWGGKADELNATPMYTLRRLDPHTLQPLVKEFS